MEDGRAEEGKARHHAVLACIRPQQISVGDGMQTPNLTGPRGKNSRG